MKSMRCLRLLSYISILAGCTGVEPTKLKLASTTSSIEISQDFHYDENYKLASAHYFYKLSSGKYVAKFEKKNGVYYEGTGTCLEMNAEISSESLRKSLIGYYPKKYRCGIFVSNQAKESPKIYYYRDKGESSLEGKHAGALINALNNMETDNIQIFRDQPKSESFKNILVFSK
jgi:hypothetical protein